MRIRFISHPDLMKNCCQEIKFKKYLFSRFQLYVFQGGMYVYGHYAPTLCFVIFENFSDRNLPSPARV